MLVRSFMVFVSKIAVFKKIGGNFTGSYSLVLVCSGLDFI